MKQYLHKVTFSDGKYRIYLAEGLSELLMKINKDKTVSKLTIVKAEEL